MLLLKHDAVAGLVSMAEAIEAVRAACVEQGEGRARLPQRLTTETGNGWLRLMPVALEGSGVMGYKEMHLTPGVGTAYLVALYDLASGALLAQMDADWLTQFRTAATSAVAADCLARPGAQRVGLIGSGEQARAHLEAMRCVRELAEVFVWSPDAAHREAFADRAAGELGLPVRAVATPEAAVSGADLVLAAYKAGREPVLRARWLAPGMHVLGIGSVRADAREIEDGVWSRADRIVVDDLDHVLESGDGRSGAASGHLRREAVSELWQVVGGARPGRQGRNELTLYKSVGTALQDLALAQALYRRARERGVGVDLGEFPRSRLM